MTLHGIGSQDFEPAVVGESLAVDSGGFEMVLTNPPFGKKSSTTIVCRPRMLFCDTVHTSWLRCPVTSRRISAMGLAKAFFAPLHI